MYIRKPQPLGSQIAYIFPLDMDFRERHRTKGHTGECSHSTPAASVWKHKVAHIKHVTQGLLRDP